MNNSSEDLSFKGFIGDNSLQNEQIPIDLWPSFPWDEPIIPGSPSTSNDSYDDDQYDYLFNPYNLSDPNSSHSNIYPIVGDSKSSNDPYISLKYLITASNSIERSTKKKRGRQNGKDELQHNNLKNDCKMAKIQTDYFNCLIPFLNAIMRKFNIKYFFVNLAGKFKSNINQKFRADLIKKTIKQILKEAPICRRYTKFEKNHNINVIDKLIEERQDIILNILEKNFLYFFERIYFPNKRKFNLSSFGLCDCEVELPKSIHLFKDLVNKNKKNKNFIVYEQKLEECAKKEFIKKSIKLINNTK